MTPAISQRGFLAGAQHRRLASALPRRPVMRGAVLSRSARAAPRARIALAGLPWASAFVDRFAQFIDEFIEFPGFPGLPEQGVDPRRTTCFFQQMQARQFDVAIQLHGSGRHVNEAIALFGADRTAGYFIAGDYCPNSDTFLEYPGGAEIHRHLRLIERLGFCATDSSLCFPIHEDDEARLISAGIVNRLASDFVCMHAGGKLATRRWPTERFAAVASALAADGLTVGLTGVDGERRIIDAVERGFSRAAINLCGQTDLGMLAALVRRARLVITNDTGMSHIAAAVRTPSVVIGLGSDLQRWAPLDRRLHRVVSRPVDCRPCEFADCPIGFTCAESISPQTVIDACRELMAESRAGPIGREGMVRRLVSTAC